ncbi:PEP-CTERM sorting domain-containing protein [Kiritimatiellota bacterium B12222]|nr:PEP-CTERM sorting domain-containing protein [Kiritimatiellota bacterium B12222]
MKNIRTIISLLMGCATLSLQADLLVYEGWNYALADATSMHTKAITATGMTGNYADITSGGSATFSTTGLSFGTNYLPTTGGSLYQSATGSTSYTVLRGDINTTVSYPMTLWGSYLVQIDEFSTDGTVKVRANYDDSGNSKARFISTVDATGSSQNTGVGYDSTGTASSGGLTEDVTYLALSSFTNVGGAGGGTATQYIFTLGEYDSWLSAGGGLEANLGSYAGITATDSSGDIKSFANYVNFVLGGSGTGTESAFIDEVRYGTTLGDVIAIPEPSSFLLMLGGMSLIGFGAFRSRRSRS